MRGTVVYMLRREERGQRDDDGGVNDSTCVGFQGMDELLTTSSSSIPYSKQSASNCSSAAEKGDRQRK